MCVCVYEASCVPFTKSTIFKTNCNLSDKGLTLRQEKTLFTTKPTTKEYKKQKHTDEIK